jgi:hypothetical protein
MLPCCGMLLALTSSTHISNQALCTQLESHFAITFAINKLNTIRNINNTEGSYVTILAM